MLRGEIRLVDFDPSVGSEANKRRPALIVSNDHANAAAARLGRGVVTVVPLTSSTSRVLPFQVFLPSEATGLPKDSKAQVLRAGALDDGQGYALDYGLDRIIAGIEADVTSGDGRPAGRGARAGARAHVRRGNSSREKTDSTGTSK